MCSSRQRTFLAFSASLAVEPSKKTVSEGAFGFFEILMISFSLGTPRVTFLEDTPAKWKVFSVIWVAGSPIDWAAIAPTISPGVAWACKQNKIVKWLNLVLSLLFWQNKSAQLHFRRVRKSTSGENRLGGHSTHHFTRSCLSLKY